MKQAFILLAAFLLVAPGMLLGQDFEVVSPVSKKVTFTATDGETLHDSTVVVKNLSNSLIRVNYMIDPRIVSLFNGQYTHSFLIYPNTSQVLPINFDSKSTGGFMRGYLYLWDSTKTDTIVVECSTILHAVDTNGRDGSVNFTYIKVGEALCTPLMARNYTNKPINIYEVKNLSDTLIPSLVFDTIIPLPYTILPGEDIEIASVCYSPQQPNENFYTTFNINNSLRSNTSITLSVTSTTQIDTNLSKQCIELSQEKPMIGPILFGGDTTHTLFFKSNRYDTTFVNDVVFFGGDGLMFKIVKPLPDTILPLTLTPVKVRFSPTTLLPVVKDRFAVDARFTTSCGNFSIDLSALAMQPTADSISTPLFPDKEYVLGMSSSAPSFSQDFHFVNNGLTNTKIVSVGLADPSPEFVVTNITPTNTLPFTLLPGEKMTVSVLFTPSQVGKVFFNQLLITTEQGIQSVSYPLQALRTTTSGVQESSDSSITVTLNPNPATTSVTVSVKGAGIIEEASMNNTIGNMVLLNSRPAKPEWTWDVNPNFIVRGVYFVRITGKTPEGKPFVASRRLVVE